ncbi:MAG: molybdopterin molybdenumtransferase MoeA [Porticoccaceae bacterium]|nr:molybdopterin molybdenumtransferase MoeA [Porticoccaceae bacterium]|tara:strand:- start:1129 stop:2325 length:1197 start_codon:yes stop_codon:yes gene_type:complete
MLTVTEAMNKIKSLAKVVAQTDNISVSESLDRILSSDIISPINVPHNRNSAMDGYAFSHKEAFNKQFYLPISQRITPGMSPKPLIKNSAARIFTGGEIPLNADTVVAQEHCVRTNNDIAICKSTKKGSNIRPLGQDVKVGCRALVKGKSIRPQEIGLLASMGISNVCVFRPLKVAIISTGDELVDTNDVQNKGSIYNSNLPMLKALLRDIHAIPLDLGNIKDNKKLIRNTLLRGVRECDVIITTGGMSVGEEDYLKDVILGLGTINFWRVLIKPGKPIVFGDIAGTPVIGLPGNPGSVFVTFHVLVKPFLFKCQGRTGIEPLVLKARANFSRASEKREVYHRASTDGFGETVSLLPNQSSGVLSTSCSGNVFVRQRIGETINHGDFVDVLPYRFERSG